MLDAAQSRRLLIRLNRLAASPPGARSPVRLGDSAGNLLRPLLRAVQRAGRDLDEETPAVALHRARVRVKRLRYACETLETLAGDDLRGVIRRLVRLQDALGEHQDAVMQANWLRAYAGPAQLPPATLLAMGAIVDALERRAGKLRRRAARAWRKFDKRRVRRDLLDVLRRFGTAPARAGRTRARA